MLVNGWICLNINPPSCERAPVSVTEATLSPGTARACSLGRRAVPGGVAPPKRRSTKTNQDASHIFNTLFNKAPLTYKLHITQRAYLNSGIKMDRDTRHNFVLTYNIFELYIHPNIYYRAKLKKVGNVQLGYELRFQPSVYSSIFEVSLLGSFVISMNKMW